MNRPHIASTFRAIATLANAAEDHTRATLDDDRFDAPVHGVIAARVWAFRAIRHEDLNQIRFLCLEIQKELER